MVVSNVRTGKVQTLYDSVVLAQETERIVVRGKLRKYYRMARAGKWYGGIASAYCCGCNLRCVYCWSGFPRDSPDKIGEFYSPEQVFNHLSKVASRRGYRQVRVTGNEPTMGKDHLFGVLELVDRSNLLFILETNGILIGHDPRFAQQLSDFRNLHVRVSLKATCADEFFRLTGATPEGFDLQLKALRNLLDAEVSFHPAVMTSFSSPSGLGELKAKLGEIDSSLEGNLEEENVILYPPVVERLKKAGVESSDLVPTQ